MLKNLFSGFKKYYTDTMDSLMRKSVREGTLELGTEGKKAYFEYRVLIEGGFDLGETLVQVTFAQYEFGTRK